MTDDFRVTTRVLFDVGEWIVLVEWVLEARSFRLPSDDVVALPGLTVMTAYLNFYG